MKHRVFTIGAIATFIVAGLSAAPPAGAQGVRRDTVPRTAQKPAARLTSMDSLVECSPVAAPARKKPVVRRRARASPPAKRAAAAVVPRPLPQVAIKPRRPVVHRVRRAVPKAATAAPVHSTTVVMCRPVRPLAALAQGTPTEQSVIPVPQLAQSAPAAQPAEAGPPLFVSTAPGVPTAIAGTGRSWLPFAIIPAIFIPFIHSGRTHHGNAPIDTTTTPIVPPVTPPGPPGPPPPGPPPPGPPPPGPPPPVVPPTTVPEPSTIALLGTGLLGVAGVVKRRGRK